MSGPRPQNKHDRRRGKTAIITGSPYKLELEEEEKEEKEKKKNEKKNSKAGKKGCQNKYLECSEDKTNEAQKKTKWRCKTGR